MSALKEVSNSSIRTVLGNSSIVKGVLAINAGGAATVKTTNALTFTIDGIQYTKAALAAQVITVTHDCFGQLVGGNNLPAYVQPTGQTAYYLLCVNAAGAIAVVQGSYAGQVQSYANDLSKVLTGNGGLPIEPAGYTAFGLLKVATAGGATFTPGTTLLDAANVTVTYFDLEYVPSVAP